MGFKFNQLNKPKKDKGIPFNEFFAIHEEEQEEDDCEKEEKEITFEERLRIKADMEYEKDQEFWDEYLYHKKHPNKSLSSKKGKSKKEIKRDKEILKFFKEKNKEFEKKHKKTKEEKRYKKACKHATSYFIWVDYFNKLNELKLDPFQKKQKKSKYQIQLEEYIDIDNPNAIHFYNSCLRKHVDEGLTEDEILLETITDSILDKLNSPFACVSDDGIGRLMNDMHYYGKTGELPTRKKNGKKKKIEFISADDDVELFEIDEHNDDIDYTSSESFNDLTDDNINKFLDANGTTELINSIDPDDPEIRAYFEGYM